jgi:hypothetical protein
MELDPTEQKILTNYPDGFDKKITKNICLLKNKSVPSLKNLEISSILTAKGVDGFRYDMAEMVLIELHELFYKKMKNPKFLLLAEVTIPAEYRNHID